MERKDSALSLRARKAVQDSERAAPGDLENRPGAVGTIIQGRTVEVSVGALDDATLRRTAIRRGKAVQHGGRLSVNLVDRSQGVAAAKIGGAVEAAIGALNHSGKRIGSVGAIEVDHGGQRAAGRDGVDRAIVPCPATLGCAVQITVSALNQRSGLRCIAVRAVKAMEHRNRLCWQGNRGCGPQQHRSTSFDPFRFAAENLFPPICGK